MAGKGIHMAEQKKKNLLYWIGNTLVGLVGISVAYSDVILPKVFPDHTIVNQLAIPISVGLKFLWDSWKYRNGTISEHGKLLLDKVTDKITGTYNSKNLPSGLSEKRNGNGKN